VHRQSYAPSGTVIADLLEALFELCGVRDQLDMHIDVSPQASITLDPRDPCFGSAPPLAKRGICDL
jgi:hypothetical protein